MNIDLLPYSRDIESEMRHNIANLTRLLFLGAAIGNAPAQTFNSIVSFNGSNGDTPELGSLVKDEAGNLYGTTRIGGSKNFGTIFRIDPSGAFTTLFDGFASVARPSNGLLLASDGNLYGTTPADGTLAGGTAFRLTPSGTFTVIHNFAYSDGIGPNGGLIQAADGFIYGTTGLGGTFNFGTVFKMSLSGVVTVLHAFSTTDPRTVSAGLVQGSDGNFYGVSLSGSTSGTAYGAVFRVTPIGVLTVLHNFSVSDGGTCSSELIQGKDGNFYGVTEGRLNDTSHGGNVFRISGLGDFTIMHAFAGPDGLNTYHAPLIQASDGNFYGNTFSGGSKGFGTVFQMTPNGVYTKLHDFVYTDGKSPSSGVVQGRNGSFYGMTSAGGANNKGTVFQVTVAGVSPPPVVVPPAISAIVSDASFQAGGPVASGSWVAIFGSNLAPTTRQWNPATEIVNGLLPTSLDGTSVTVNGKPAAVNFISPGQVNIQAPDDVAMGPVQLAVTTASGGASAAFTMNYAQFAPGLFPAAPPYLAAQHADNSYVGNYPGATPAKPGETIILWGTGFGPASPPVASGRVFNGANALANEVTVTIGGKPAVVDFAGVVGAGLVQINVQVPAGLNDGDAAVVASVGGVTTEASGNMIAVMN